MEINLYLEMNNQISELLRLSEQPAQMYAAALIDAYRNTGLEPEEIPQWIPVSKEKPNDTVIGCDKWGNVEPVLYIQSLKKWKIMPNACVEMDVIYWQPLPQPPKGEKYEH